MKKYSLSLLIFIFVTMLSLRLHAEESYLYTSLLMQPECGGDKEHYDEKVLQYLESFVIESEAEDENGQKKLAKGKLLENDDAEHYGDRVIDFDKVKNAIISSKDEKQKECLRGFFRQGMKEWQGYLNKLSKDYGCGLELGSEPVNCGYHESKNTFTCSSDKKTAESLDSKKYNYEMDILTGTIEEAAVNKKTCTKTKQGEDLSTFIQDSMMFLAETNNNFLEEEAKLNAEKIGKDKTQLTEAGNCNNPRDCGEKKSEQKNLELSQEAKDKACCEHISENWTSLGFSTVKGEKPSEHLCKAMIDKDADKDTTKIAEQCIRNLLGSIGAGFVDGVKSFFSLFQAGWISSIPTLLHELKNNPLGTMKKIMMDMVGFDENVWSCVNGHTQVELGCSMLGKFVGSNFGFGAGVGLTAGALKSSLKGLKAVSKIKAEGGTLKKIASSGKSISLKKEFKDIMKTTAATSLKAPTWPLAAAAGAGKAVVWGIKRANLVAAAKFAVKTPIKVTAAAVTLSAGVGAKTASKAFSGNANLAKGFNEIGDSAFALTKEQFSSILGKSSSQLAKEIKTMQRQTNNLGNEVKTLQTQYDNLAKDAPLASKLANDIKAKEASFKEVNEKLTQAKIEFYKNSTAAEQRSLLAKNTERINDLKKSKQMTKEQAEEFGRLQKANEQIRKSMNENAALKNEEWRKKLADAGLLTVTASGVILNQSNTSYGKKANSIDKPRAEDTDGGISVPQHQNVDETKSSPTKSEKPKEDVKPSVPAAAVSPKKEPVKPTEDAGDLPPPPDMRN